MGTITGELRRPFYPKDIQYKIQTVGAKAVLCVCYVDARHVQERLNQVVPGMWSNSFREVYEGDKIVAVESTLEVQVREGFVVSHADVGSFDNVNQDYHGLKAVYSDAFKRSAVPFGVGQCLYVQEPSFLSKENPDSFRFKGEKIVGITDKANARLRNAYEAWLESKGEDEFGEPL